MHCRLKQFAAAGLSGGLSATIIAAEQSPAAVDSHPALEQLTLRNTGILFTEHHRERQLAHHTMENGKAKMAHRRLSQFVRQMNFEKQKFIDNLTWLTS
jgi:hypothetical protein